MRRRKREREREREREKAEAVKSKWQERWQGARWGANDLKNNDEKGRQKGLKIALHGGAFFRRAAARAGGKGKKTKKGRQRENRKKTNGRKREKRVSWEETGRTFARKGMNKRRGEGIDRKGGLTKKFDSKKCNSSAFRIQIIRGLSRILRVFARNLPLSLSLSLFVFLISAVRLNYHVAIRPSPLYVMRIAMRSGPPITRSLHNESVRNPPRASKRTRLFLQDRN